MEHQPSHQIAGPQLHLDKWVKHENPRAFNRFNRSAIINNCYRGEVGVILANRGGETFTVTRGLRIAQLAVAPVSSLAWHEVDSLPESKRGSGGFGSPGR